MGFTNRFMDYREESNKLMDVIGMVNEEDDGIKAEQLWWWERENENLWIERIGKKK